MEQTGGKEVGGEIKRERLTRMGEGVEERERSRVEVMEKSSLEVEAGVGWKLCFGTTEFKSSYGGIKGKW